MYFGLTCTGKSEQHVLRMLNATIVELHVHVHVQYIVHVLRNITKQ